MPRQRFKYHYTNVGVLPVIFMLLCCILFIYLWLPLIFLFVFGIVIYNIVVIIITKLSTASTQNNVEIISIKKTTTENDKDCVDATITKHKE